MQANQVRLDTRGTSKGMEVLITNEHGSVLVSDVLMMPHTSSDTENSLEAAKVGLQKVVSMGFTAVDHRVDSETLAKQLRDPSQRSAFPYLCAGYRTLARKLDSWSVAARDHENVTDAAFIRGKEQESDDGSVEGS